MKFKNIVNGMLIGKTISIINAKNKKQIGLSGKIVDETRNMIKIETKTGEKSFVKKNIVIHINQDNKVYEVPGIELFGRIEERIKK
ncbi:ribonuclease P protein subunit [Candidatus Woesearchaeota archaeon]|nr:ribonuclease P protein subunit [Candidatus Woesearchaeota archaeon]